MLVVHPASLCDVCLDPYVISSEPANSPHAIACGHIFCLTCLRNLTPSACPLCRKTFQPDRVKKLHVAGAPELDGAAEETIEAQASQLLQRVALASLEGVPEVEIIEVVTEVQEWLSRNSEDDDSHRPLRAALAALQSFKALQERTEREYTEYRRVRRELKAYRRNAHQESKTSRAVEESLHSRIEEIENKHALEVSQDNERREGSGRLTHVFQLSRLRAELGSLRGDPQHAYHNTSNPLPPPPEPLPLERFPPFARPGGAVDVPDPLLGAVPYPPPPPPPPPPPRAQPSTSNTTTNGYRSTTPYAGTSHTQYVPTAQITRPLTIARTRPAEASRVDDRSRRPSAQEVNGISYSQERRRHAESNHSNTLEGRYTSTEGTSQLLPGPSRRNVSVPAPTPSPAPSWAHEPIVEGRSDEEREVRDLRRKSRPNGTNSVNASASNVDLRPAVGTRLTSAEAYINGYASGYDSGFQIASETSSSYAPSSYGSDRSERGLAFPVHESSPDQAISGLGLMGVPQPSAPATVSTPDENATPMNRARRLTRRNTTQAVETDRSTRGLGDHSILDLPSNTVNRRAPMQTIDQVLGVRRTATEGGIIGGGEPSRLHISLNRFVAPLAGENESPRSETTWGTVQTLSRDSFSGGSMSSLSMLVGLHNGGARGQGSVASGSYIAREDLGDNVTSEEGEGDETETPILTGSLPGSDVSGLGLITEDEGDYSRDVLETSRSRHRTNSYSEQIPSASETVQDRQPRRSRRSEGTNDYRRHVSQPSTNTEALQYDGRRAANTSNITNALSLHFDASLPAHDYRSHTFSVPSGPEIIAPTPIVGGPNIIHLWANRT